MKDKVGASLYGAPMMRRTAPRARNPSASLHGAARRGTDAERRCHDGGDRIGMVIVYMHDCWQRIHIPQNRGILRQVSEEVV
jgi:hypothetical protein